MKPLYERIADVVNAIAEASASSKQASLIALQAYSQTLILEVKELEEKQPQKEEE